VREDIAYDYIGGLIVSLTSSRLRFKKLPEWYETGSFGRGTSRGKRRSRSRNFCRLVLVRIPHDPTHAGQCRQFFGRALRVAAGYKNAAIRIHPLQPPDGCPRIFICAVGHGAGIQHDNFGVASGGGALQSALKKLPLECGTIRLRSAAAKIFYVEARHTPILNEWTLRL